MKRKTAKYLIPLVLLLLFPLFGASAYETLKTGDEGEAVLALKTRMYELGYFTSMNFSDEFNDVTARRVQNLQKMNKLEQTGIATAELQELIFSAGVLNAEGKTAPTIKPTAVPTPSPAPVAPSGIVETPQRNDAGFLLEPGAEFVFRDEKDGRWIYLSDTLQVDIKRFEDKQNVIVWYETDVKTMPDEPMRAFLTEGSRPGLAVKKPEYIARQNKAVLAISDDFFGYRIRNKITTGVIVRNGEIYSTKTKKAGSNGMPNLETMAYFKDGTMKTYDSDAYTAQEYIDMGAEHVIAFGPALVRDGELTPNMKRENYYHYHEPRCALGMIEQNHYIILTVKGRTSDSKGVYLTWLADKMLELGAQEAINLDGGGTAALVFMGEQLNMKNSSARQITGMLGFGVSDKAAAD